MTTPYDPPGASGSYLPLAGGTMTGPIAGFKDKGGQLYNAVAYGASPASPDNTAILNTMLALAYTAGGGTIYYPAGGSTPYKHLGQILIPTNGANPPLTVPIRITGDGAVYGDDVQGLGASQLDFRYAGRTITDLVTNGTTTVTSATANFTSADVGAFVVASGITSDRTVIQSVTNSTTAVLSLAALTTASGQTAVIGGAKIEALGWGILTIDNVDLINGGTDPLPILRSTNTICKLSCGFMGVGSGSSCVTDAWIAGGINHVTNTGTPNDEFQGYGSVMSNCGFHKIRRHAVLQTGANGINIHSLINDTSCGSSLPYGAPIEIHGDPTLSSASVGNTIHDNTFETTYYAIGAVSCTNSQLNVLGPNGVYDESSGPCLACYYFDNTSSQNQIIDGFHDGTLPIKVDACPYNNGNSVLATSGAQPSGFSYSVNFFNHIYSVGENGFSAVSGYGDTSSWVTGQGNWPDAQVQLLANSGAQFTDGVTNSTTTFTSATAAFATTDVGRVIYSLGNIPFGTTIIERVNATTIILSQAATTSATGLTFYMQRTGTGTTAWTLIQFERNHIVSQGSAPSGVADAGAGSSPSGSSTTGTDLAFTFNITTGTGTTSGDFCHINPAKNWTNTPHVTMTASNAAAAALMAGGFWLVASVAGAVTVYFVNAPATSTAYVFNFTVIQ